MTPARGKHEQPSVVLLFAILIGLLVLGMLLGPVVMILCLVAGTVLSLTWTVRAANYRRHVGASCGNGR
jgi:ABC-type nickel/cobalt efflux system permease component RcnA